MFVEFDKVFNNGSQAQMKIPKEVVKYLNKQLPSGTEYSVDQNGNCTLVSNGTPMRIGGFRFNLTEKQKKILGNKPSNKDIMSYSYNAQDPIALSLEKEGIISINGEELPIEKLIYNPLSPVKYISGSFFMEPEKFPDPFNITIGCKDFSRTMIMKRVPNESIADAKFESQEEASLVISYIINEKKPSMSMTMTISLELQYAKSAQEIIESAMIYNAFLDGEGTMFEEPTIGLRITGTSANRFEEADLVFWNKVVSIEKVLCQEFPLPQDEISYDTVCLVEELYQTLVNHQPIREQGKIETLEGVWDRNVEENINNCIGQPIRFDFVATRIDNLFSVKIKLPCLVKIFNARLVKYSSDGAGKLKIYLEDESESKTRYYTCLLFKDEESMACYQKDTLNSKNAIEAFMRAKTAREFLSSDK